MSFKAYLNLDGKDYRVLKCDYEFTQKVDAIGKPSSINYGGRIDLTVESTDSDVLPTWMLDNFERKAGTITYKKVDNDAKLKEIKFEDGYCVKYKENFDAYNEETMTETFTISARKITIGNAIHENEWV